MAFAIDRIDHFVLNCRDVEAMAAWYGGVLGMRRDGFAPGRMALAFGRQKINLRPTGAANWITGDVDAPGSADFCLITKLEPKATLARLAEHGVAVLSGPEEKTGALGPMISIYCRDPDGNLVEIAHYPAEAI